MSNLHRKQLVWGIGLIGALMTSSAILAVRAADQKPDANKIFEYDLTATPAIASGEPQICVDPQNPLNIAAIEYAHGHPQFPIYKLGSSYAELERDRDSPYGGQYGDISISHDGGNTWTRLPRPSPVQKPPITTTSGYPMRSDGDPMIACGANGALYVGGEVDPLSRPAGRPAFPFTLPDVEPAVAASKDFGKTWTAPVKMNTPADRPWLTVDQSTGKLYSVSSGELNFIDHTHNIPGPNAIVDRWLVAYAPMLRSQTEPRRLGGPDFAATVGNTIAAAQGIIAATFVIVPAPPPAPRTTLPNDEPEPCHGLSRDVCHVENVPGEKEPHIVLNGRYIPPPAAPVNIVGSTATSNAIPESLKSVVSAGVSECTAERPCLFFETSKDDGLHWTRHYVPMPGGFSTARAANQVNLAVDAGHPGRYAIALPSADRTNLRVTMTNDYGVTWSAPVNVPESAKGIDFKQWLAYGPTGVLGLMWKKQRDDMQPASADKPVRSYDWVDIPQPGFDVYNTISCDGGRHWETPVRVNGVTSPGGRSRHDDLSYIALDERASHLVWGDRRLLPEVPNVLGAFGGTHAFYGRVPFTVITKCGP